MKQKKQAFSYIILTISLMILILDSQTALLGVREGILLCISVVIPSLFPLIFLSTMLPSRLLGSRIKGIRSLSILCGIPDGAESMLLLSFLGGYPVGAGMVADAYRQGCISNSAASRMLGFCNNAGPAFLFGMVGSLFSNKMTAWILWLIHILSALLVGIILPDKRKEVCILSRKTPVTVPDALETCVKTMANICGWVVLFRVILTVLERWLLWLLPQEVQVSVFGLMELSNGISCLKNISNEGTRFVVCSGMLAFGGLCVMMQTASVTKNLGLGQYFPGKVLQCLFSILFSVMFQFFLFSPENRVKTPSQYCIFLISAISVLFFFLLKKNSSSISRENIV